MSGKLIVFEGVEGCGKTTQLARSQAWLFNSLLLQTFQVRGQLSQLVVTREPGGTDLGQQIRQLLLQPAPDSSQGLSKETIEDRAELLLYAADRAQHIEAHLKPQLEAGALILCDRYTDSTVAYQGYGRGIDLKLIDQLNQIATGGLESDLTLWLDLDVEAGLVRTKRRSVVDGTPADRIEQADLAFHRRVQQGFRALAIAHPERIVRVDASQSEAVVAAQIQSILEQYLNQWFPPLLPPLSDNPRR
jgi:dTMP kinase